MSARDALDASPSTRPISRVGLLAIVLAGGLCIIVVFQAWLLITSHRNALRLFEIRAANRAQANANQIAGVFRQVDLVVQDLRDHVTEADLRTGHVAAGHGRLHTVIVKRMQRMPKLVNLHVVGSDGRILHSSAGSIPTINVADRPYFQEQRDARNDLLVCSPPLLGRVSQRWNIVCSRRLTSASGGFSGIILTGIDADILAAEMQAVDQQDWILALVHDNGQLATRQPADPALHGRPIDAAVQAWLGSDERSRHGAGMGMQETHVWGRSRVPGLPLTVIAGYAEDRALLQWRRDLHSHLVATALLVGGALIVLLQQYRRDRATAVADQLDHQLRSSELALAELVRQVPVGVFRLEGGGDGATLAYASPRCHETIGDHAADPAGLLALVHPDDAPGLQRQLDEARTAGEFGWTGRIRIAGAIRWLDVRATAAGDGAGGWNGVVQDITRRREAEMALRHQQELMQAVFNHAPIGILLGDPGSGSASFANPAAAAILGRGIGALTGRGLDAMADAHESARLREALARVQVPGAAPEQLQVRCLTGDGRRIELDVVVSVIRDADGQVLNGLQVFRDITEERRLATQVRHAEKMQAVGLLAGGIAHDFNNILAAISGFTELARRRRPPEPIAAHLEQIGAAADRAKTLVRQILTFSRQDNAEQRPVHLQSTVREVMALLRATLPSSVEIASELAPDVSPVLADAGRIHQVVMNLCSNAVHAMHGNGLLRIQLDQVRIDDVQPGRLRTLGAGTYARLTVSDTGCGMEAATLERIFDPFFTTKGPQEGTGLGLAVVWGVIESHQGDIQVQSRPGHGTTFRIFLPVIARPASEPPPVEAPTHAVVGGSERILVVDDEPTLRELFSELLRDLGYRVETCSNGHEALSVLQRDRRDISLVITDETMPGMTGSELIVAVAGLHPDLPFILCSGLERREQAGMVAGRVQYCMKPVAHATLVAMVRRALDGGSAA